MPIDLPLIIQPPAIVEPQKTAPKLSILPGLTVAAGFFSKTGAPIPTYGYAAGGYDASSAKDTIDKVSFASDGNATDVGNLIGQIQGPAGCYFYENGYIMGGINYAATVDYDYIQKRAFSSDGNAADIGNLSIGREYASGCESLTYGYCVGGYRGGAGTGENSAIDHVSFASDGNGTNVATVWQTGRYHSGCSSSTHGYKAGGYAGGNTNTIEKFVFATEGNGTDVGNLVVGLSGGAAQEYNDQYGYYCGGVSGTSYRNQWSFQSDGNASSLGSLTVLRSKMNGASSATHGYSLGGNYVSNYYNVIDKFAFPSSGTCTDVGNLTVTRCFNDGFQGY